MLLISSPHPELQHHPRGLPAQPIITTLSSQGKEIWFWVWQQFGVETKPENIVKNGNTNNLHPPTCAGFVTRNGTHATYPSPSQDFDMKVLIPTYIIPMISSTFLLAGLDREIYMDSWWSTFTVQDSWCWAINYVPIHDPDTSF